MGEKIQVVRKEDYDEVLAYAPEYFVQKWNLDKPDVIELTEEPVFDADEAKTYLLEHVEGERPDALVAKMRRWASPPEADDG